MDDLIFELKEYIFLTWVNFPLYGDRYRYPRGEKISVIGANGSGKSTLLQMLDGLIFPDGDLLSFSGKN